MPEAVVIGTILFLALGAFFMLVTIAVRSMISEEARKRDLLVEQVLQELEERQREKR